MNNPVVKINVKNYGQIVVELYPGVALNTVNNFLKYVVGSYYNNTTFHRIIPGFMIQGGQGSKSYEPIKGEFSANGFKNELKHTTGIISMARTSDPNSATSQFFIMDANSPHLDGQYAGFGATIEGIDIVNKIANAKRDLSDDSPLEKIIIENINVELNGFVIGDVIYY